MRRIIWFIVLYVILFLWSNVTFSAYYHPNSDIETYVDDVNNQFIKIEAQAKVSDTIDIIHFKSLYKDFSILKDKLPQIPDYQLTYNKCYEITKTLSEWWDSSNYSVFKTQCMTPYKEDSKEILTKYAVHAKIHASPIEGNSPLTVTFDANNSVDPSWDTIPNGNFYWYFKDDKWHEVFIGKWTVVKYTFENAWNYVVHLTAKSVNHNIVGTLDGSDSININVKPSIANVVLYINGKRAFTDKYIKITSEDAKSGVKFDASPTTSAGGTDIKKSKWSIISENRKIYTNSVDWFPGIITEKLLWEGYYKIEIIIEDNTGKTVKKTFKLMVSDPVAIIKANPEEWNTNTNFSFDASTSYSSKWRIINYKWTLTDPTGKKIDSFESKKFKHKFKAPWFYTIKLEVADDLDNKNTDTFKVLVESAYPVPKFTIIDRMNWEIPSAFILDASPTYDSDLVNGDELSYNWSFSNNKFVHYQTINNGQKAIVQFDKIWEYTITLTVTDKFGKVASTDEKIKVDSVLRPEVSINPNYTVLGNDIVMKAKTNKTVSYYEWDFGDKVIKQTQSGTVSHKYKKSGVYDLILKAYSIDGDYNSITEKVFIWQKWYPIAIYDVYKWDDEKVSIDTCKIIKDKEEVYVKAYKVSRQEKFTINAGASVNAKWEKRNLKIYYSMPKDDKNIIWKTLVYKFDEKGCQSINLTVIDKETGKESTEKVWFNVKNAKPKIDNLTMFFPQYWGEQVGAASFSPSLKNNQNIPADIFTDWVDPLLVRLNALNAHDPDGSMITYFRWYYFNIEDKTNILQAKVTPYNVPTTVFSIPKIPGEYMFGVEVCDVDGECISTTNPISEWGLWGWPVVVFPSSSKNPDIPIVAIRVDNDQTEWLGEVNVWDKIYINVIPKILSNRKDFRKNMIIKVDFDWDGKYDLTTKKEKIEYVFRETGKYRIKAKVIYRWYGGIWYISNPLIVKNGLKPLVITEQYNNYLLYWDLSYWDIDKKELCFDMRKCRKKDSYYKITEDKYGLITYATTGSKQMFFYFEDKYWNTEKERNKINIDTISTGDDIKFMSIPRAEEEGDSYKLDVWWALETSFLLYFQDYSDKCYIDKDISFDSDQDGDTANDHDFPCNMTVKIDYPSDKQVVIWRIYYGENTKDFYVNLLEADIIISPKFEEIYSDINKLILEINFSDSDSVKYLKMLLLSLQDSLGDKIESDSLIFQLQDWLDENSGILEVEQETQLKKIILSLQDKAVTIALDQNEYYQSKEDILILVPEKYEDTIRTKFEELEAVSWDKDQIKSILQDIMNMVKDWYKAGDIDDDTLNIIKADICDILNYYEIESEACWTAKATTVSEWKEKSLVKIIFKILLYTVLFLVVAFIWLMLVFVIKARNRRKWEEDDEYEDEIIEDEEIVDDYVDDATTEENKQNKWTTDGK